MNTQNLPLLAFGAAVEEASGMSLEEAFWNDQDDRPVPVKMSRWTVVPGGRSPVDQHSVRECWMIASGTGTLRYRDREDVPVRAGDVLYFDSQQSHELINDSTEPISVFSIWWPAENAPGT
ncbi:MAG: cupin domain-containing protein [Bacteroidota bacterium]